MQIQLSEHFTYKKLFRFTGPTIIMMIFTSLYGIVDGLFVSNVVGKTAFAAVNLILPFPTILSALGFMIGTGGSALISKTMGEGDDKKANSLFSLMVYLTIVLGTVISVIGLIFVPQVAVLLGAQGEMVDICVLYGRIYLSALPLFMLQYVFQSFLVVAEKPKMGLAVTIAAGVTNMILDALFMAVFDWGVAGADGVSAYGVIMYCNFIFISVFLGYSIGSAPIIGFQYGAGNYTELKSLLKKSAWIIGILSVVLMGLAEWLAPPLSRIFVGYDSGLLALTQRAFRIYSVMFLFCGFNIFGSSFFTALNNGLVSAIISFLRTLVFQIGCVLILPILLDIDGIWLSVVIAELLSLLVTVFCIFRYRNRYHYI